MSRSALRRATLFLASALGALAIFAPAALAAGPPVVNIGPPLEWQVGLTVAGLQGTINPNGLDTTYKIEYGKTKSYGKTTVTFPVGNGEVPVTVEPELFGLEGKTTYHFRAVATNSSGTTTTGDIVFENQSTWKVEGTPISSLGHAVGFEDTSLGGYIEFQGAVFSTFTRIRCAQTSHVSGILGVSISTPEFGGCFVQLNGKTAPECKPTSGIAMELNGQMAQTGTAKITFPVSCPIGTKLTFHDGGYSVSPTFGEATALTGEFRGVTYFSTNQRWDTVISLDGSSPGSWILTGTDAGKKFGVGH